MFLFVSALLAQMGATVSNLLETKNKNDDVYIKIKELAKYFRCSESVLARRALDNKKIDKVKK